MKDNKNFEQLKKEFIQSAIDLLDYMYINSKNFNRPFLFTFLLYI